MDILGLVDEMGFVGTGYRFRLEGSTVFERIFHEILKANVLKESLEM